MGQGTSRICKRSCRLPSTSSAPWQVLSEDVRRDIGSSGRKWAPPHRRNSWRYLPRPNDWPHPARTCLRCPHDRSSSRKVLEFPSAATSRWVAFPPLHAGARSEASSSLFPAMDQAIGARETLFQTTPPTCLFGLSPLSEATGDSCPWRPPLRQYLLRPHLDSFHRLGSCTRWPWHVRSRTPDRWQCSHPPHPCSTDHDLRSLASIPCPLWDFQLPETKGMAGLPSRRRAHPDDPRHQCPYSG